jgi:hypothetical protein
MWEGLDSSDNAGNKFLVMNVSDVCFIRFIRFVQLIYVDVVVDEKILPSLMLQTLARTICLAKTTSFVDLITDVALLVLV